MCRNCNCFFSGFKTCVSISPKNTLCIFHSNRKGQFWCFIRIENFKFSTWIFSRFPEETLFQTFKRWAMLFEYVFVSFRAWKQLKNLFLNWTWIDYSNLTFPLSINLSLLKTGNAELVGNFQPDLLPLSPCLLSLVSRWQMTLCPPLRGNKRRSQVKITLAWKLIVSQLLSHNDS